MMLDYYGIGTNPLMTTGQLQYYMTLSTRYQILGYSRALQARQPFLSWIPYYRQLSTRYQISGDSQWIANQAAVCELDTIWPRYYNTRAYS
jgi:hypothetical protein